jgi:hypothetical protein
MQAVLSLQTMARRYIAKSFDRSRPCHNQECCICIDAIRLGVRLACGHMYHTSCINKWSHHERSCPLCRQAICNPYVEKIEFTLAKYEKLFSLPIETLLEFESAVSAQLIANLCVHIMLEQSTAFFAKVSRIGAHLDTHRARDLREKCKTLCRLKNEILDFDANAVTLYNLHHAYPITAQIKQRLQLPFERLFNRTNNMLCEFDNLENETNPTAQKMLRGRLCKLVSLERSVLRFAHNYSFSPFRVPRRISIIGPVWNEED